MNIFKRKEKKEKIWGRNEDGTPYIVGITVNDLMIELSKYPDNAEVCMVVCPKKYMNGGGYLGKLVGIEKGATGQIWLKGRVIDQSMEIE